MLKSYQSAIRNPHSAISLAVLAALRAGALAGLARVGVAGVGCGVGRRRAGVLPLDGLAVLRAELLTLGVRRDVGRRLVLLVRAHRLPSEQNRERERAGVPIVECGFRIADWKRA